MATLIALLVGGAFTAAIYALSSVAFTISYSTTKDFNIAQGASFALGGYSLYTCMNELHIGIVLSLVVTVLIGSVFGALIEIVVYSRLRRSSGLSLGLFVASLGLLTLVDNVLVFICGPVPVQPSVFYLGNTVHLGGTLATTLLQIVTLFLSLIVIAFVSILYNRTKLGKTLRAVSDSPFMARCIGVSLSRTYLFAYLISSGIAALAGALLAFDVGATSNDAISFTLIAIMVVLLTGVGHAAYSFLVAFVVGLAQSVLLVIFPDKWIEAVVFLAFLIVILLRPSGRVVRSQRGMSV
jgi:branched-chain amino acid transport system permease protein